MECRLREMDETIRDTLRDLVRGRSDAGPEISVEYLHNLVGPDPTSADDISNPLITACEGGCSNLSLSLGYWIRPLPNRGDLLISLGWSRYALDRHSWTIPFSDIDMSVQNVVSLW